MREHYNKSNVMDVTYAPVMIYKAVSQFRM